MTVIDYLEDYFDRDGVLKSTKSYDSLFRDACKIVKQSEDTDLFNELLTSLANLYYDVYASRLTNLNFKQYVTDSIGYCWKLPSGLEEAISVEPEEEVEE